MQHKNINVAIVGNPNVGKSSLVNALAGSNLEVGNWSGVTVEKKTASITYANHRINLIDLPGMYSLKAYTQEEHIAANHLLYDTPEVIVQVVDSTNIERNLYLTTQLLDLNIPLVIAFNMSDEAAQKGLVLNTQKLQELYNISSAITVATKNTGFNNLLEKICKAATQNHNTPALAYAPDIQSAAKKIIQLLHQKLPLLIKKYPLNWLSFQLLEQNEKFYQQENIPLEIQQEIESIAKVVSAHKEENINITLSVARHNLAKAISQQILQTSSIPHTSLGEKIDKLILHKYLGVPIFLFFMWLIFKITFDVAAPLVDWTDAFFTQFLPKWSHHLLTTLHTPEWAISLINHGIIAGVGFVLTFVPIIFILMLCITLLESTGYMARVAFVMDKLMHTIGLHGKSFIALLIGFGCNVTAIYATRTLESNRDRILTALITPLMSCSARLPVYVLFTAALFPNNPSVIMLGLYLTGIVLAIFMGIIFKNTLFTQETPLFLMELPPYRIPSIKNLLKYTLHKVKHFLRKAGTYILLVSIVVWFLLHLPWGVEHKKDSYLGQTGQIIAPALEPIGFGTWEAASSLLTGIIAKEIVIGTMAEIYITEVTPDTKLQQSSFTEDVKSILLDLLYAVKQSFTNITTSLGLSSVSFEAGDDSNSLQQVIKQQFTSLSALSFMIFVLLYMPCIVTGIAMKQEFGSWKWFALTSSYGLVIAWLASFAVYQVGGLML